MDGQRPGGLLRIVPFVARHLAGGMPVTGPALRRVSVRLVFGIALRHALTVVHGGDARHPLRRRIVAPDDEVDRDLIFRRRAQGRQEPCRALRDANVAVVAVIGRLLRHVCFVAGVRRGGTRLRQPVVLGRRAVPGVALGDVLFFAQRELGARAQVAQPRGREDREAQGDDREAGERRSPPGPRRHDHRRMRGHRRPGSTRADDGELVPPLAATDDHRRTGGGNGEQRESDDRSDDPLDGGPVVRHAQLPDVPRDERDEREHGDEDDRLQDLEQSTGRSYLRGGLADYHRRRAPVTG